MSYEIATKEGQFCVKSITSGKTKGCFDTKEEAQEQALALSIAEGQYEKSVNISTLSDLTLEENDGIIEVSGYLLRYSKPDDTSDRDLHKQWWSKDTYLMQETFPIKGVPIMYSHATKNELAKVGIGVVNYAEADDIGIFIKGQLNDREKWLRIVEEVNHRKKLGLSRKEIEMLALRGYENIKSIVTQLPLQWSMGSYPPTYQVDRSTGKIETAGIVEATLTPVPAEPYGTEATVTFKSFLDIVSLKEPSAKEDDSSNTDFAKNNNDIYQDISWDGFFKMAEEMEKGSGYASDEKVKSFFKRMNKEFMRMMAEEVDKMVGGDEEEQDELPAKMTDEDKEEMKAYFTKHLESLVAKDTGFQKAYENENYDEAGKVVEAVYQNNIEELVTAAVGSQLSKIQEREETTRKAFSGAFSRWRTDNPVDANKSSGSGGYAQDPEETRKYIDPSSIKDYENNRGLGDFFRELYQGKNPNLDYTKSMKTQNPYIGTLGGVLQGQQMSQTILDPLRAEVVTFGMGITETRVNNIGIYTVPKMTTVPNAYRPGINDQITETEAKYDTITAMLRPLAARIVIPRQMLMTTGTNMEEQLKREIIRSLRLQIDKEILQGVGSVAGTGNTGAEIKGIKQHLLQSGLTANIPTLDTNGRKPRYEDLINAETQIATGNVELDQSTSGWIMHPRDRGTFRRTFGTDGHPLLYPNFSDRPYEDLIGYKVATTTQISIDQTTGTNSDTSDIYFGNWRYGEYVMGNDIEVIYDDTTRADQLQVRFIVFMYSDFIVHYPEAFYVMQGVRS